MPRPGEDGDSGAAEQCPARSAGGLRPRGGAAAPLAEAPRMVTLCSVGPPSPTVASGGNRSNGVPSGAGATLDVRILPDVAARR